VTAAEKNIQIQRIVVVVAVSLLIVKFVAYVLTHSVAILTDALESIVNVVAGTLGLYSLIVSARPRDEDHPYGHGKVEFISSAVEGTLIVIAAILILYESINSHPYGFILRSDGRRKELKGLTQGRSWLQNDPVNQKRRDRLQSHLEGFRRFLPVSFRLTGDYLAYIMRCSTSGE